MLEIFHSRDKHGRGNAWPAAAVPRTRIREARAVFQKHVDLRQTSQRHTDAMCDHTAAHFLKPNIKT